MTNHITKLHDMPGKGTPVEQLLQLDILV